MGESRFSSPERKPSRGRRLALAWSKRRYGLTAARTAAPTTDSAKLTALLPLLSWLSEPRDTFWDLSVWPLLSLVSSLFESKSVPAFTLVTRSVEPSGVLRSVTVELKRAQPTASAARETTDRMFDFILVQLRSRTRRSSLAHFCKAAVLRSMQTASLSVVSFWVLMICVRAPRVPAPPDPGAESAGGARPCPGRRGAGESLIFRAKTAMGAMETRSFLLSLASPWRFFAVSARDIGVTPSSLARAGERQFGLANKS